MPSARRRHLVATRAATLLSFAAMPTFAVMAVLAMAEDVGATALCSPATSVTSGMAPMYFLMSGFHAAPWLRLLGGASIRTNSGGEDE